MTQPDLFGAPASRPPTRRAAPCGQHDWPPTRAEALRRLAAFTPRMGAAYAATRNFDRGPERRDNVSLLSPYLRRRLVTEAEVVRAAVGAHGAQAAEKFVQEAVWRSYWKGWLEHRPAVWRSWREGAARDRAQAGAVLSAQIDAAEAGRTGIDCFDAWTRELVETGWLHNHARMWWASIWIFTLRLPWRLGADFFLRHLLDGDPASNTLSWRWVAGLHTPGKHYLAKAWNIEKYTGGRFSPAPHELAEDAEPLSEAAPPPRPVAPPAGQPALAGAPTALLVTAEDLCVEADGLDLGCAPTDLRAVATVETANLLSDLAVAPQVRAFEARALADAATRLRAVGAPSAATLGAAAPQDLARWARAAGATQIVTAWPPVGPTRDWLDAAQPALTAAGVRLTMARRQWDDALWPHATAGFFKLKARIPAVLKMLD